MPSEQSANPPTSLLDATAAPAIPDDHGEWEQDTEELPRRPRRRLLAPIPVALLAILMIACGFIGGVEVEKGQTGSSSGRSGSPAGAAAARRGGFGGAAAGSGGTSARGSSTSGSAASGASSGSFAGAGGRATVGEVSYVRGNTLYVENTQGNTVKVTAGPGAKVTKTVTAKLSSIHPGETVIVAGEAGKNGSVSATSISIGSAGGLSGGLGGLFGGSAGSSRGASSSGASGGGSAAGSSGGPSLFGE